MAAKQQKKPAKSKATNLQSQIDWRDLIGFEREREILFSLALKERLPQTLLISGFSGMGKRHFAKELVALPFCQRVREALSAAVLPIGQVQRPCGYCADCLDIIHDLHDEVLWIERAPQERLKLEDAKAIHQHLELEPQAASYGLAKIKPRRCVVLVDCHALNFQGFNSLLKLLEEPPEHALLIMTTSDPQRLLPTIRSRLMNFKISPPERAVVLPWLRLKMGAALEERKAVAALSLSGGAPYAALKWLTQVDGELEIYQELTDLVSLPDFGQRIQALDVLLKKRKLSALELLDKFEVALNQSYRESLNLPQDILGNEVTKLKPSRSEPQKSIPENKIAANKIKQRRAVLSRGRDLAAKKQIAINATLLGEALLSF